jgi:thiol-disulfide isomerase/thioredoxin
VKLPCLAALAAALVLGACSTPAASGELPGPVPDGAVFRTPPDSAPAAPALELELIDGRALDLTEQWDERPIVLVFFETWCTLCRDQQPEINDVVADYRDVVLFVGIANMSDESDVEEYVSANGITYPVGIDRSGRSWLNYAVSEPPLVALISKDGRLLRGWPEGTSGTHLHEQIDELAVETR